MALRKRPIKVIIQEAEKMALEALAFVLDREAERIHESLPDLPASEAGKMSVENDHATSWQVLHALADWIRDILKKINVWFL